MIDHRVGPREDVPVEKEAPFYSHAGLRLASWCECLRFALLGWERAGGRSCLKGDVSGP